jgi:glycosyltransferase involved in cell wall biosynthesis
MAGMQSQVAPFIQACNAMALVSEVEAFSVVILECMASARPMVVTDVGGAREQIEPGKHGYIVPVAEPEQIANSLARLWFDGNIPAFGAAARASVAKRFSVESMVDQYTSLLVDSVKRSKRSNRA